MYVNTKVFKDLIRKHFFPFKLDNYPGSPDSKFGLFYTFKVLNILFYWEDIRSD
jgi:hypothetical protein